MDSLHQIQQTVLDKGTWRNSPIPPPVLPPANDTKLSVSTVLVPESPTVNGSLETPLVSSVLTYVSTNSSIATTLLLNYISLGLSNAELLSTFRLTSVSSSSAGIASLVNVFFSNGSNTVNLYSQFSSGANSQLHGWSINDFTYSYTEAMLGKPMDSVLDTAIGEICDSSEIVAKSYFYVQILSTLRTLEPRYLYSNFQITQQLKFTRSLIILSRLLYEAFITKQEHPQISQFGTLR